MIRVLIAEDEPASAEYLAAIIRRHVPEVSLCGVAEDGVEALERIEERRPQILIADISMPRMDGLKLAEAVQLRHPHVRVVFVSGYQEFEYARGALQFGVTEYLLKPVKPAELSACVKVLAARLVSEKRAQTFGLLGLLMRGLAPDRAQLDAIFDAPGYCLALARSFGMPALAPFPFEPDAARSDPDQGVYVLCGRDAREYLLLWASAPGEGEEACPRPVPEGWSAVVSACAFPIVQLRERVEAVCAVMDQRLCAVPFCASVCDPLPAVTLPEGDPALCDCLREAARAVPLARLHRKMRETLLAAAAAHGFAGRRDMDAALTDAFQNAVSFGELCERLETLHRECAQPPDASPASDDGFGALLLYIDNHLADPLSLYSVSRACAMSQTTINRLFRKHLKTSFVSYLTRRRMDRARRLLREQPSPKVRDIAEQVGYADPLYFSRVFRAHTGLPPKRYVDAEL